MSLGVSFSTRTMRPEDWSKVRHFKAQEFVSPESMGFEFILWLDELRERADVPMILTSSYRTTEHNRAVGGASNSAHTDVPCNAADFGERPREDDPNWNKSRFRIVAAALELGCTRIGSYTNGSLHIDRSEGRRPGERMWRAVGAIVK